MLQQELTDIWVNFPKFYPPLNRAATVVDLENKDNLLQCIDGRLQIKKKCVAGVND